MIVIKYFIHVVQIEVENIEDICYFLLNHINY